MKNLQPEYDSIGRQYQEATTRPLRKYAYEPTVRLYLPEMHGKRVLDLACGDGVITRMMRDLGARELVGLDLSSEMIQLAQSQNTERITYARRDCMNDDLTSFGKFDLATGMMFLHYASSRADLEHTVQNIRDALYSDGMFYGMILDPDIALRGHNNYGVIIPSHHKDEGQEIIITLENFEGKKYCEITDHYWKRETYEELFQHQGFSVEWLPGIVSQEGLDLYGQDFWKAYLQNPVYLMLRATLN
jgi:SAM-dependent methyltransferase